MVGDFCIGEIMDRLPIKSLENAIDVYKFSMETCLKNKVEDYVPTLDKATISFLEESIKVIFRRFSKINTYTWLVILV